MSDLTDRADSRLNQVRADRLNNEVKAFNDPTPKPTIYLGEQGDRSLVQTLGEGVTASGVLQTNGAIASNSLVEVHGNSVDAMPRVKRSPKKATSITEKGKLKISYYFAGDANAYFGGWQKNKVVTIAYKAASYVDNLGGNRYAIDTVVITSAPGAGSFVYGLQYQRIGDRDWTFDQTVDFASSIDFNTFGDFLIYYGRGFWETSFFPGTRTPTSFATTNYPDSLSLALYSGIESSTTFNYSVTYSYFQYDPVENYNNSWTAYLFPDVTLAFANSVYIAPYILPDGSSNLNRYGTGSASGAIVLGANLPIAVGFAMLYSGSVDSRVDANGTLTVTLARLNADATALETIATPTIEPTLLSLRDTNNNTYYNSELKFSNYFLEVDDRGYLRAFKKSDLATLANGDFKLDCLVYDKDLEYVRTEKIKLFKPSNFTSFSTIQNVSYHS